MMQYKFSTFLRLLVCGVTYTFASGISAQEPIEIPNQGGIDIGFEEIAAPAISQPNREPDQEELGYETLTRGPLHEAFAEPIVSDPVPGMLVLKEPPAPINELPPEYRPDSEDAIWIAGYWGWDDEREDYVWISGVYRVPPEGHQWVPGYWNQVNEGWQWVQGFWVEDVADSIEYLPPPPATLENGPSSPSPGVNYFYIPGNWSQSTSAALPQSPTSDYLWNVGYWHPMQDDLVWIPAHVVWTPRGCVFVNGYWDRRLPMRGLCFAPVFIPRATYTRPGWSLRPNVVLNSQVILHNLFVQPRYSHYMFGDYYGMPMGHRHVVPAYVYHQSRGSYDPLISFYSAYNARQGQDMIRWYGNQYADLSRNPSKRPPKTWSPVNQHSDHHSTTLGTDHPQIAHMLDQVNKLNVGPKISPITAGFQQEMLKLDSDRKRFAKDREETERKAQPIGKVAIAGVVPPTLTLPKLDPGVSRKIDLAGKNDTEQRKGKMPEKPRSTNRQTDGLSRDNNAGQTPRRADSIPKNLEPKRMEMPSRVESNRISNPLDTDRVLERLRQSERNKTVAPKTQSTQPNVAPTIPNKEPRSLNVQPKLPNADARLLDNETRLPKIENRMPNIENRIPKIENRIPKIESRMPNIENRMPKIESRIPNNENRQPNVRPSLPNRIQPPNTDIPKNNRGGGLLDLPRNNAPAQPIVPGLSLQPNLQGNNGASNGTIPQQNRQPGPELNQKNSESGGRKNADKGDGGKKPK